MLISFISSGDIREIAARAAAEVFILGVTCFFCFTIGRERLGGESLMRKKYFTDTKLKPVHPGEHLREDFLKPLGLTAHRLAMDLRVPATRIADIVGERRGITSDTALRLARYFGTTPEFWMNMQVRYELDVAEDDAAARIEREVMPLHQGVRG